MAHTYIFVCKNIYLEDHGRIYEFDTTKYISRLACQILTLMLLVANSTNTKWCEKPEKSLKPWQMGTHLRVLSESFQMNTNMTGFRWFSKIFAFLYIGQM